MSALQLSRRPLRNERGVDMEKLELADQLPLMFFGSVVRTPLSVSYVTAVPMSLELWLREVLASNERPETGKNLL